MYRALTDDAAGEGVQQNFETSMEWQRKVGRYRCTPD